MQGEGEGNFPSFNSAIKNVLMMFIYLKAAEAAKARILSSTFDAVFGELKLRGRSIWINAEGEQGGEGNERKLLF